MMNYLAGLLGIALLGALLIASVYRADAADYKAQLVTLQSSYKTAAVAAETHAQAVEAKQQTQLDADRKNALSQASSATSKANAVRAVYLKKLADLSKQPKLDLGHQCANVGIPGDIIP